MIKLKKKIEKKWRKLKQNFVYFSLNEIIGYSHQWSGPGAYPYSGYGYDAGYGDYYSGGFFNGYDYGYGKYQNNYNNSTATQPSSNFYNNNTSSNYHKNNSNYQQFK